MISRRGLLAGFAASAAGVLVPRAPAIVRSTSLMPVRPLEDFLVYSVSYRHVGVFGDTFVARAWWHAATKRWYQPVAEHEYDRDRPSGMWMRRNGTYFASDVDGSGDGWEQRRVEVPVLRTMELCEVKFGSRGSIEMVTKEIDL
jgi:hypothetical protein